MSYLEKGIGDLYGPVQPGQQLLYEDNILGKPYRGDYDDVQAAAKASSDYIGNLGGRGWRIGRALGLTSLALATLLIPSLSTHHSVEAQTIDLCEGPYEDGNWYIFRGGDAGDSTRWVRCSPFQSPLQVPQVVEIPVLYPVEVEVEKEVPVIIEVPVLATPQPASPEGRPLLPPIIVNVPPPVINVNLPPSVQPLAPLYLPPPQINNAFSESRSNVQVVTGPVNQTQSQSQFVNVQVIVRGFIPPQETPTRIPIVTQTAVATATPPETATTGATATNTRIPIPTQRPVATATAGP